MLSEDEYANLLEVSVSELMRMNEKNNAEWSRFARWDFEQKTGLLVFSNPTSGLPDAQLSLQIQIIGSLSTRSSTWMWAWHNPTLREALTRDAEAVHEFGVMHGIAELTTPLWKADEADGWTMTALAVHLCGAIGAYRAPADNTFIYLALYETV